MSVKKIPDGFATVTPYLVIRNASAAIEWYKQALGAEELMKMAGPDGRLMHAEIRIGNSIIMITDEFPEMGASWCSPQTVKAVTGGLFLYSEDCDAAHRRAVAAGAKSDSEPENMFWGDRYGRFTDPFGHSWSVATHIEDVTHEEMARRQQQWMASMATGH